MTWLPDRTIERLRAAAAWPEFTTDRYTVVEEIGRGGMGAVYLARDEALRREVAIKVSNAIASPTLEQRIRNEARVLARLEHAGIVPIHDVGRLADGRLFYVMKRVRGETLLALRAREAIDDPLRVFERICETVAFAHAHGCIHRDLKPENVMVGAFGEVMVLDWGVAKIAPAIDGDEEARDEGGIPAIESMDARGTESGTVLGTPGYMAPEQASGGAGVVDERADVYGLGAILHVLLVGEPPPVDPDEVRSGLDAIRPPVPAALRAVCARALARLAADRYPDVPSLAADVGRYRRGLAVDAHPETVVERVRRLAWTYRTPILLVLAYIVMRVVVALTAGW